MNSGNISGYIINTSRVARNHKNLWRRRFESAPRGIPIEVKDIRDGVQIACAGPARSLDLCARYWCRTAAAKPEGGVDRGHGIVPGGGEGDCERDIHALPRELIGNVSGQKILRVGKVTGFIFCLRGLAPQRNRLAFLSRISVSGAFYGNRVSLPVGPSGNQFPHLSDHLLGVNSHSLWHQPPLVGLGRQEHFDQAVDEVGAARRSGSDYLVTIKVTGSCNIAYYSPKPRCTFRCRCAQVVRNTVPSTTPTSSSCIKPCCH